MPCCFNERVPCSRPGMARSTRRSKPDQRGAETLGGLPAQLHAKRKVGFDQLVRENASKDTRRPVVLPVPPGGTGKPYILRRESYGPRRSRQNGWLGTRVRESQMTCVRVRVTTSSEVVHRRHRDEKEHKGATKRN